MSRAVVAVTGLGAVTCLGGSALQSWNLLKKGKSGIHQITRFPTTHMRSKICGSVDYLNIAPMHNQTLGMAMAEKALGEALSQARLSQEEEIPGPLYMGYGGAEGEWAERRQYAKSALMGNCDLRAASLLGAFGREQISYEHYLSSVIGNRLCDRFHIRGPSVPLTTACASGASAIALATSAIRRGNADIAIAGGTDSSVNQEAVIRFSLLSALSTANNPPERACKPFAGDRDGIVLGEGAGFLVLESEESARARGVIPIGYLLGYGSSSDAFHRTRSRPDGGGCVACVRDAIKDAGICLTDIDYVNAHGSGTRENDRIETLALKEVFGRHAYHFCLSSNKSMLGHTLNAAGVIEVVMTLMTLGSGIVPPTANYDVADPELDLNYVPNHAVNRKVNIALSNSFGFGGQNMSLVIAGNLNAAGGG